MRTVTRVSIRKALCRRVLSPALVAPPSPAALHHLLDHQKGSQRKLSLQGWVRREVGPGASQEPSPLSLVFSKVEAISLPLYCITVSGGDLLRHWGAREGAANSWRDCRPKELVPRPGAETEPARPEAAQLRARPQPQPQPCQHDRPDHASQDPVPPSSCTTASEGLPDSCGRSLPYL